MVYALHLAQAADIGALDPVEGVYAQVRIMEEVFHATAQYYIRHAGSVHRPRLRRIQDRRSARRAGAAGLLQSLLGEHGSAQVRDADGARSP